MYYVSGCVCLNACIDYNIKWVKAVFDFAFADAAAAFGRDSLQPSSKEEGLVCNVD